MAQTGAVTGTSVISLPTAKVESIPPAIENFTAVISGSDVNFSWNDYDGNNGYYIGYWYLDSEGQSNSGVFNEIGVNATAYSVFLSDFPNIATDSAIHFTIYAFDNEQNDIQSSKATYTLDR